MLKRREECTTYLTHVCRHNYSEEIPVKRWNMRSFQPTLWLSSAIDVTPGSLRYSDVYRHESGRCCTLSFILTFFTLVLFTICLFVAVIYQFWRSFSFLKESSAGFCSSWKCLPLMLSLFTFWNSVKWEK